jgi:hypothetical protein
MQFRMSGATLKQRAMLALSALVLVTACDDDDDDAPITPPTAQVLSGEAEYEIVPTQPLAVGQVIGLDNPGGANGLLDSLPEPTRSMTVAGITPAPYGGQFPAHNNASRINLRMKVVSGRFAGRDISPIVNLPQQGGTPTETQDSLAAEFVFDSAQVIGSSPAQFVRLRLRFGTLAPA